MSYQSLAKLGHVFTSVAASKRHCVQCSVNKQLILEWTFLFKKIHSIDYLIMNLNLLKIVINKKK